MMPRALPFAATVPARGYQPVYTSGCLCPGCHSGHWDVRRSSAECVRCGLALPLAPERAAA
jgi:hypothetical protein